MKNKNAARIKRLAITAMLCALAYALVFLRFSIMPALPFLSYDPKDVVILLGGFIYGPVTAFAISVVVSFIEMITVGTTGWWGFLMNVISTCALACTASAIYKFRRSASGAVAALLIGCVAATGTMVLWNYLITPIYMEGITRAQIVPMLLPAFMPFNLIKHSLNTGIFLLVYKPAITALRRAKLLPKSDDSVTAESAALPFWRRINAGTLLLGLFLLATCILAILVMKGII